MCLHPCRWAEGGGTVRRITLSESTLGFVQARGGILTISEAVYLVG